MRRENPGETFQIQPTIDPESALASACERCKCDLVERKECVLSFLSADPESEDALNVLIIDLAALKHEEAQDVAQFH